MQIKLFGKELFGFKKGGAIAQFGYNQIKESKFLPDFFKEMGNGLDSGLVGWAIPVTDTVTNKTGILSSPKIEELPKKKLSPKDVYTLEMLNNKGFKINFSPEYVDKQVEAFKDKLALIKSEEYDMRRGTEEIASILIRMENRKKYVKFNDFFDQFPYTTSGKIDDLVKEHDYLKIGQVAQFMADLPNDAVATMKSYTKKTKELCDKEAVFYIIADKKDFEKTTKRRDPILLAQSPFGHFWQILGAWDKEMLLVEEL